MLCLSCKSRPALMITDKESIPKRYDWKDNSDSKRFCCFHDSKQGDFCYLCSKKYWFKAEYPLPKNFKNKLKEE